MGEIKRVWIENGFKVARGIRRIRRGRNKGRYEVLYLKGSRIRKVLVTENAFRPALQKN